MIVHDQGSFHKARKITRLPLSVRNWTKFPTHNPDALTLASFAPFAFPLILFLVLLVAFLCGLCAFCVHSFQIVAASRRKGSFSTTEDGNDEVCRLEGRGEPVE